MRFTQPPLAHLLLTPNQTVTRSTGEFQSVTVRATDDQDRPLPRLPIMLSITSGHPQKLVAATDALGLASFQYAGARAGAVDTLRASAPWGAVRLSSPVATVSWNNGVNQAPQISAGPDVSVTLPDSVSLAGRVSDDGLPTNSTLSLQWTVVNGPGPVRFDPLREPVTRVSFTVPGLYTLLAPAAYYRAKTVTKPDSFTLKDLLLSEKQIPQVVEFVGND